MRTRPYRIWTHLSEREYTLFRTNVKRSGLSQERYIRLLLSGHTPKALPPIEYHKLLRQLYAIGKNMNQIAARATSTGFFLAEEYARTADELRQALLEIPAALTLPEQE